MTMSSDGAAQELGSGHLADRVLLVICSVISICILCWALYFSQYGLDITDEGFYLNWFSQPDEFHSFISQFGFVYRPLYLLVGRDLVLLRQANVLLTYSLGTGLAYVLIARITVSAPSTRLTRLLIASGYGTAALLALVIANSWLPTPSYNTLATQALLLAAIGVSLASTELTRFSALGWAFIGLGGWLAYMAKPTTAAVLAFCVGVYFLLAGLLKLRFLIALAAWVAVLLLSSIYAIDGGLSESVERLKHALHLSQVMGGGHTVAEIWRLEIWPLSGSEKQWWFILTMLLWLWCLGISTRFKALTFMSLFLAVAAMVSFFAVIFCAPLLHINIGQFQHLLVLAVPLAAFLYTLTALPLWVWDGELWRAGLLAVFLIVLPYVYVFGTNSNYWLSMGAASVFWAMAALATICVTVRQGQSLAPLLVVALAIQGFVTLGLHTSLEKPYRQSQPLFLNDYSFIMGAQGSSVIVGEAYGKYLQTALESVEVAGFDPGTPMIDLTGQSPGLLHIFAARSVGQAWMLGGYPGSYQFAAESLSHVHCSVLGEAWLLTEPGGPRSISTDVLQTFGANMQDYIQVGSWETSPGAGGYQEVRTQLLYKPIPNARAIEERCEEGRTR